MGGFLQRICRRARRLLARRNVTGPSLDERQTAAARCGEERAGARVASARRALEQAMTPRWRMRHESLVQDCYACARTWL
jgi:hypothetical protein